MKKFTIKAIYIIFACVFLCLTLATCYCFGVIHQIRFNLGNGKTTNITLLFNNVIYETAGDCSLEKEITLMKLQTNDARWVAFNRDANYGLVSKHYWSKESALYHELIGIKKMKTTMGEIEYRQRFEDVLLSLRREPTGFR